MLLRLPLRHFFLFHYRHFQFSNISFCFLMSSLKRSWKPFILLLHYFQVCPLCLHDHLMVLIIHFKEPCLFDSMGNRFEGLQHAGFHRRSFRVLKLNHQLLLI